MSSDGEPDEWGDSEEYDDQESDEFAEWDEEEFTEALRAACAVDPPRLFALCEEFPPPEPVRVFAWGLDLGGTAVVSRQGGHTGRFRSAERARDVYGRGHELHLCWVDTAPAVEDSGQSTAD